MHTKLLLVFAFASVVSSHDILIGSGTEGRKIFDEIRQANPAIWRQIENVTIIAPDNEVISGVVVTDMRPEKDGDVQIVDGGDGMKSVTIELKSPTVLRGYEFHLEVYTVPETKLSDAEEHLYTESTLTTDKIDLTETSEATSHEKDGSGEDEPEIPDEVDKTTELPESTTNQDIPELMEGKVVDGDILRPAREASNENNPETTQSEDNLNVHPSIIGSEADQTTTENVSTEVTTEAEMTTKLDESEVITVAPESFDNSKNIPDYPSLSILDYIKSREGARPIRRTDDESNESNDDATTTEKLVENTDNVDTSYMLPTSEASSSSQNNNDDTADLVPPEETNYNTGFSLNNESTEKPVNDDSTDISNNRPRGGRGLDFEESQELITSTTMSDIESSTSAINNDSESSTTEATIDEQLRNARETDVLENNVNGLDATIDSNQNKQIPLCRAPNESDKTSNLTPNVIILNGEQLTLTPDSNHRLQFGIPIVLIIGSDTNIPTIRIIAEGAHDDNKDTSVFPSADNSMDDNEPVPEDKLNDSQEREYSEDEFIPKPVMSFK
ncbi:agglutinin-like protein 7 [Vanessa cardui]|uniref:agglutinin-like protein 7 n=1 Tax=Vanessa cardui TaxID=171605 RepID=UPI001F13D366|nr:agglutinin-like protein 7 [Vanessa cardui]